MSSTADALLVRNSAWPSRVRLIVDAGEGSSVIVDVAKTFWSRFRGLLGRSRLASHEGLLFVPGGSIHTLGMRFAIDIVFIDARLNVLRVVEDVKPWRFVFAPRHTRFVLELKSGTARALSLHEHGSFCVETYPAERADYEFDTRRA